MKKLLFILLASIPYISFSQKVDVTDSLITVDGNPYAKIVKENARKYTIYDLSNRPVMVLKFENTTSPTRANSANRAGNVFYTDVFFLEQKKVAQSEEIRAKVSKIASYIVKNKLFKDGRLDTDAVDNYILMNPVAWKQG